MSKRTTKVRVGSEGTMMPAKAAETVSPGSVPGPTAESSEEERADDRDNRPLTSAEIAQLRRVPRVKTLRRALGLTQQEFAARYQIPLGTLRDWEQGRTEPDQAARAYLNVIAHDPQKVQGALRAADKT